MGWRKTRADRFYKRKIHRQPWSKHNFNAPCSWSKLAREVVGLLFTFAGLFRGRGRWKAWNALNALYAMWLRNCCRVGFALLFYPGNGFVLRRKRQSSACLFFHFFVFIAASLVSYSISADAGSWKADRLLEWALSHWPKPWPLSYFLMKCKQALAWGCWLVFTVGVLFKCYGVASVREIGQQADETEKCMCADDVLLFHWRWSSW